MIRSRLTAVAVVVLALPVTACFIQTAPPAAEPAPEAAPAELTGADDLVVNGIRVSPEERAQFEQQHQLRVPSGAYWYDARSGAWGLQGGATSGFTLANGSIGGVLRADASGGGNGQLTGVFINGRELHPTDVQLLAAYLDPVPGRYWVDANGDAGYEGLPAMVNLVDQARSRGEQDPFATAGRGYPASDGGNNYLFEPTVAERAVEPAPDRDSGSEPDPDPASPDSE